MTELLRISQERAALRTPEKQSPFEQDTVRIGIMRMSKYLDSSRMLPDDSMIEEVLATHQTDASAVGDYIFSRMTTPLPEMTSMVFEVKAPHSVNPGQLVPPGGGGMKKDPDHPVTDKKIITKALEKLFQEIHQVPHKARYVPDVTYTYRFDHPKRPDTKKPGCIENTTHLVLGYSAPHDPLHFFDPQDKLQGLLSLPPSEISRLFDQNALTIASGETYRILDSLSTDPAERKKANVTSDGNEYYFKAALEEHAYVYEAQIQRKIILRLEQDPRVQLTNKTKRHIQAFGKSRIPGNKSEALSDLKKTQDYIRDIEAHMNIHESGELRRISRTTYDSLIAVGIPWQRIQQRMRLTDAMLDAVRVISLEQSAEYYAETEDQYPFLLSKMLSQIEHWGTSEYELIARCPEMLHVVRTVCDTFHINPADPDWYTHVQYALKAFRYMEIPNDADETNRMSVLEQYEALNIEMKQRYCRPVVPGVQRIGSVEKIGTLSNEYNMRQEITLNPFAPIVSKQILTSMKPSALGSLTSEIPELLMQAFGVSQYVDIFHEESPGRQETTQYERAAAWDKLISLPIDDRVSETHTKRLSQHIKPMRQALYSMFGKRIDVIPIPSGTLDYYELKRPFIERYKHTLTIASVYDGIDLSEIPVHCGYVMREKNKMRVITKHIERGKRNQLEKEMTDTFGIMFGMDEARWKNDLTEYLKRSGRTIMPEELSGITTYWRRWVAQLILQGGFVQSVTDMRKPLHPKITVSKGRASPEFDGVIPFQAQEFGSASAQDTIIWIKAVFSMEDDSTAVRSKRHPANAVRPYQAEIQWFPNLDALTAKKTDDDRFTVERLIEYTAGRYPPIWVRYGGHAEAYEYILRYYYAKRMQDQADVKTPWYYDAVTAIIGKLQQVIQPVRSVEVFRHKQK